MADNYLEKHYAEYEERKRKWLQKKGNTNASREQQNPWSD